MCTARFSSFKTCLTGRRLISLTTSLISHSSRTSRLLPSDLSQLSSFTPLSQRRKFSFQHYYKDFVFARVMDSTYSAGTASSSGGNGAQRPFLIGVAGGTASGKSTVCQKIMQHLGQADVSDSLRKVVCISQDSFYKQLSGKDAIKATKGQYDFDHPNALDLELMFSTLQQVLNGEKTEIPKYDYVTNARTSEVLTIYPADVVLFEGILVFYFPQVCDLFHMKLFVDTDPDTRLSRRVVRDVQERGRDLDTVLKQYMKLVKPAFEEFCLPTKKFADVIIPRGADNTVAISLIVQHIKDLLASRNHQGEHLEELESDDLSSASYPKPTKRRLVKELSRPH